MLRLRIDHVKEENYKVAFCMGIDKFFSEEYLTRLLRLPEGMRRQVFDSGNLSRDEKFVLANLYLLDAYGKISRFKELLPTMTDMSLNKIKSALFVLEKNQLIEWDKEKIILKVRPMDYRKCLPEKISKK
jgi:hypothetical protein